MERLIILSDLWGNLKSDWIAPYTIGLKNYFEIELYDSCELGKIYLKEYSEKKIHQQFINGGVEKAVENLLKKEIGTINVLGFSIGGYIAWKSACKGLHVKNLTAVSSTRLRYETSRPKCEIELIYGGNDKNKPGKDWYNRLQLDRKIYKDEEHDFYTKREIAIAISDEIIRKTKIR